jgi:hypothetical protein
LADLSKDNVVSSKCLWQFQVATMPSVADVAPLARVCALQDMCTTDTPYATRTQVDQASLKKGAQVRIPRVCSHPAQALQFAKALHLAAQECERYVMAHMQREPTLFDKEDAALKLVHQPFARRARTLENAFHDRVAANDALYVSRPRGAQETQDSDRSDSGDDEELHEA